MKKQFDYSAKPDYSGEEYQPPGPGQDLHFVSRFLVTFFPENDGRLVDLVALAHYTYLQHSSLAERYLIQERAKSQKYTLHGFWGGFNSDGELKIFWSGSESLEIKGDKDLDNHFLSSKKVITKLELIMPHIKALGSITFMRY